MASDGADGDGVSFSSADGLKDVADVLRLPGGVAAVANDDVGSFDEGPLQILVGRLPGRTPGRCAHVAEAGLAAGGVDGRDNAGVACELAWCGEAIDGADLAFDDNGKDVGHTGESFEQLDGRGQGDPFADTLLELSDLVLEGIQSLELLGDTTLRLWREA